MQDVSKGEGRTVLFVSHNMAAVRSLCKNGIVLKDGMLDYAGKADECVNYYMSTNISELINHSTGKDFVRRSGPLRELEYLDIRMLNDVHNMSTMEPIEIEVVFKRNNRSIDTCQIGVLAKNGSDELVWASYSPLVNLSNEQDLFKVHITIPHHNTPKGRYTLNLNLSRYDYSAVIRDYDIVFGALVYEVNFVDPAHEHPFTIWPFRSGTSVHESTVSLLR